MSCTCLTTINWRQLVMLSHPKPSPRPLSHNITETVWTQYATSCGPSYATFGYIWSFGIDFPPSHHHTTAFLFPLARSDTSGAGAIPVRRLRLHFLFSKTEPSGSQFVCVWMILLLVYLVCTTWKVYGTSQPNCGTPTSTSWSWHAVLPSFEVFCGPSC